MIVCRAALVAVAVVAVVGTVPPARGQAPAQALVREITKITGELYRFRNNNHYSIFTVTPGGIIATDPINADDVEGMSRHVQAHRRPN